MIRINIVACILIGVLASVANAKKTALPEVFFVKLLAGPLETVGHFSALLF